MKLLSVALFQLSGHLSQSLLVQVVDERITNQLHNSGEQVQSSNQITHIQSGLSRLVGTQGTNVTQSDHDNQNDGGADALGQLTEEAMQGVNSAFLAVAGLPLVVVDGIAHHGPGNGGIDTHTQRVDELADGKCHCPSYQG